MSLEGRQPLVVELPRFGVHDTPDVGQLRPGFARETKNCFFRGGLRMRHGYHKNVPTALVAATPIRALKCIVNSVTGAQWHADGGGTWAYTTGAGNWITVTSGLSVNPAWFSYWSATGKLYRTNGLDVVRAWNGSTVTTVPALPPTTKLTIPYRDRLLFTDILNPGLIRWTTPSYVDTDITSTAQGIRLVGGSHITALAPHTLAGTQEGINAMIFVATGSSCALLSGTNLNPGPDLNTRLDHISDTIGTYSPWTVVSTPVGTFFLGSDHQVYLLPYGSSQLRPVGQMIREALKAVPLANLTNASACYHDGFYKLGIGASTGSGDQFWLDVENLRQDENGHYTPWYGPMQHAIGLTILAAPCDQTLDPDTLVAGGANGLLYHSEAADFSDDTELITFVYISYHDHLHASGGLNMRIEQSELETAGLTNASVFLTFYDTHSNNPVDTAASLLFPSPGRAARRYDDFKIQGRRLATSIGFPSSKQRLVLYTIRHEARQLEATFGTSDE
jgi:hypothetical protein